MRYLDYLKRFTYTPNEFYEYLKGLEDAAGGDVDLVILPAMTGESSNQPALKPTVSEANSTENPYVATVAVQLMNKANDKVLEWFNGTRKVTVDISSTAGTIAIDDNEAGDGGAGATFDLSFENGVGTFIITLGGEWAAEDTIKINADKDASNNSVGIMSYTVKVEDHFLIEVAADSQQEE